MQTLIIVLTALALLWLGARWLSDGDIGQLVRSSRIWLLVGLLCGALLMLARGQMWIALALLGGAVGLLRLLGVAGEWRHGAVADLAKVTTDHLDLRIDTKSGRARGRILKGFFKGRRIEDLRPVELAHLWHDCRFEDAASAELVARILDAVHPTWREDLARDEGTTQGGTPAQMTVKEAREILGVDETASDDEIRRSHRELMQRLHPDRGGSNYLAAKVNEAKALLLKRRPSL
jgi:hypothetical protein